MDLQRTKEWHLARLGKITSSRINDILGAKGLGQTGKTYCGELADDLFFGIDFDELENTYLGKDVERGVMLEPMAFDKFNDIKSNDFIHAEKVGFITLNEKTGSSPDGLVSDNSNLEIKCPSKKTFGKVVRDNYVDPKYYNQMQHQMLVSNKDKCYYFNYFIWNAREYYHEIIVKRDDSMIKIIETRIDEAYDLVNELYNKLKQNQQF